MFTFEVAFNDLDGKGWVRNIEAVNTRHAAARAHIDNYVPQQNTYTVTLVNPNGRKRIARSVQTINDMQAWMQCERHGFHGTFDIDDQAATKTPAALLN